MKHEARSMVQEPMDLKINSFHASCFLHLASSLFITLSLLFNLTTYTEAQNNEHSLPALVISSPEENSSILGTRVTVDFVVGNLVLTNFDRVKIAKSGQGHLHFWLDQASATKDNSLDYFRNEAFTFTSVPPGEHTLVAEVVNNDHTPFEPRVTQIVHFKTELPKDVKISTSASPVITRPVAETQILPNLVIPLLIGLVLVNGGVLLWLWKRRK